MSPARLSSLGLLSERLIGVLKSWMMFVTLRRHSAATAIVVFGVGLEVRPTVFIGHSNGVGGDVFGVIPMLLVPFLQNGDGRPSINAALVRLLTSSPIKMRMESTFCHSSLSASSEPISKYPVATSIAFES